MPLRNGYRRCFILTIGLTALAACGAPSGPLNPPIAAVMLGDWTYSDAPAPSQEPSLNIGIHVTLTIDTAAGTAFGGRVTSWFVGDVGEPPAEFSGLQGSIDGGRNVRIEFRRTKSGTTITILGVVAGDVLSIRESRLDDGPGPFAVGNTFDRVQ